MISATLFDQYDPKTWYTNVLPVLEATENPSDYGFASAGELLNDIARRRKVNRPTLQKQLLGARFLQNTYPVLIATEGVRGGYSQVEYLEKIHALSPALADEIAPSVISGALRMPQIKQIFQDIKEKSGRPTRAVDHARSRALDFERTCLDLVAQMPERFGVQSNSRTVAGYSLNGIGVDIGVITDGKLSTVIECKVGSARSLHVEALYLCGLMRLVRDVVPNTWLLIPESARAMGEEVRACCQRWGFEGLRIGLVREGEELSIVEEL